MSPTVRHGAALVVLVGGEAYFYLRYVQLGAQFHFWLHALLGGALGLGLLVLARLVRPGLARPWRAGEAGLVGHLWSAVPDVLFLAAGVLHVAWMDVFSLHITAHFLWPGPLLAALVLWGSTVLAWTAERLGERRLAAGALLLGVAFLGVAVALRAPLPTTLQQVIDQGSNGGAGRAWGWVCQVPT